jgi:MFS transporter, DHA2 family, multidrug resistance protein
MSDATPTAAPPRAGLVLVALILVVGVANLNPSVANVALPDIGRHFDSSQTMLDLIAVGYSLGLAASVLYLGALGGPLRPQADAAARAGALRPRVHSGSARP